MKKILTATFVIVLFFCINASAQTYEVPQDYILKVKEDYPKYEQDVIKTADWLQQTAWGEQTDKRILANRFLMAWITGSPNVTVSIGTKLINLTDKNTNLLFTYLGQFAKYMLEHKDAPDANKADLQALKAMIAQYKQEPARAKDSDMEKLVKIEQEGKLEAWIATELHK